ncbi:Glucose repression protein GAL83 (SPM1 protein), partial [Scheffersomyces stipitis CBS 6054]
NITVPVDIKWVQGGEKVYVTGSFTGWRKMIGLSKQPDNSFLITLGLPVGTHRFRFVIDNELRFSDFLPTATDQMGNFVNYVEVTPEHIQQHLSSLEDQEASSVSRGRTDSMWRLTNDDDDMGNGYSRYHDEDNATNEKNYQFINDIPPIFTDSKVMEQYYIAIDKQSKSNGQQQAWLHPPQLPPHLENVILNNYNSSDRDNNGGALPIPNHVVLNHLATTSIKHNTLAVASVVRYKRKYVTQVLYAPLQ